MRRTVRRRRRWRARAARSVAISAKNAYVTQVLIAINVLVYIVTVVQGSGDQRPRREGLREGAALRPGRRRRGLVATDHLGVPAREPPPPRLQHARALVVRRAGRALPRTRALPAHLHRLRPGRRGRRAAGDTERRHGRRVGRDLRDPRRGARPRAAAHVRPRRKRARDHHRQHRLLDRRPGDLDRRPHRRAGRRSAEHARADALRPKTSDIRARGRCPGSSE